MNILRFLYLMRAQVLGQNLFSMHGISPHSEKERRKWRKWSPAAACCRARSRRAYLVGAERRRCSCTLVRFPGEVKEAPGRYLLRLSLSYQGRPRTRPSLTPCMATSTAPRWLHLLQGSVRLYYNSVLNKTRITLMKRPKLVISINKF